MLAKVTVEFYVSFPKWTYDEEIIRHESNKIAEMNMSLPATLDYLATWSVTDPGFEPKINIEKV